MLVDRTLDKSRKNCGRCFLDETAVSNIPILGKSNHSERTITSHARGSLKHIGISAFIIDVVRGNLWPLLVQREASKTRTVTGGGELCRFA